MTGFNIETPAAFSHIYENLWLGSHPSASGVGHKDFHVIFVFDGRPSYPIFIGQTVIVHPFDDIGRIPPNLPFYLNGLADMAVKLSEEPGKVLLHCSAGINRSALVMGLVLMRKGFSARDAINLMREKRSSMILMNKVFEKYLLDLDYA